MKVVRWTEAESPMSGEWGQSRVAREPRGVQRGRRGRSMTPGKLPGLQRVSGLKFIRKHTKGPLDGE